MSLSPEYLELLACPACKGDLSENTDGGALECAACQLHYPIEEGIPLLLIERAEKRAN
ncbi:MAG: Trm112 family protein [bacterium]|nr:Trm112 family protein [bacterium]